MRNAAVTNRTCSTPTKTRYKALHLQAPPSPRSRPHSATSTVVLIQLQLCECSWQLLRNCGVLSRHLTSHLQSFVVLAAGQVQAARVGHYQRHPGHSGKKWQFTSLQWWSLFALSLTAQQLYVCACECVLVCVCGCRMSPVAVSVRQR